MQVALLMKLALLLSGLLGFARSILPQKEFSRLLGCYLALSDNCDNLSQATQCNSLGVCIDQWRVLQLDHDSSDQCLTCQNMLSSARGAQTRGSSGVIKQVGPQLDPQFCDLMPSPRTTNQCRTVVEQDLLSRPELWQAELGLQVICHLAELCNSPPTDLSAESEETGEHVVTEPEAENRSLCQFCQSRMDSFKTAIDQTSDDALMKSIIKVIRLVSADEKPAVRFLFNNFQAVRSLLTQTDSSSACSSVNLCPDLLGALRSPGLSASPPSDFLLCSLAVDQAQQITANWQNLGALVESFCRDEQCYRLVSSNVNLAKTLRSAWPDSVAICKSLGFTDQAVVNTSSNSPSDSHVNDKGSVLPYTPSLHHVNLTRSRDLARPPSPSNDSQLNSSVSHVNLIGSTADDSEECAVCLTVMAKFIDYLKNHQYSIMKAVDGACRRLPIADDECERFFNTLMLVAGDYLLNYIQPSWVCHYMGMCLSDRGMTHEDKPLYVGVSALTSLAEHRMCRSCMTLSGAIYDFDDKIDQLVPLARTLCYRLPSVGETVQCRYLVDHYLALIVRTALDQITPDKICAELEFCDKVEPKPTSDQSGIDVISSNSSVAPAQQYPFCHTCSSLVQQLQGKVGRLTTAEEDWIVNTVFVVCDEHNLSDDCGVLAKQFAIYALNILLHPINAWKICPNLGLCSDSSPRVYDMRDVSDCIFCDYILDSVNSSMSGMLGKASVVEHGVVTACESVKPFSLCGECRNFFISQWNHVRKYMSAGQSTSEACASVGYCRGGIIERSVEVLSQQSLTPPGNPFNEQGIFAGSTCDTCKNLVDVIKQFLAHNSDQEIKDLASRACENLSPPSSSLCQQYVSASLQLVLNMLRSKSSEQICRFRQLCSADVGRAFVQDGVYYESAGGMDSTFSEQPSLEQVTSDCMQCQDQISRLTGLLNKSRDDEVKENILHLCNDLSLFPPLQCEKLRTAKSGPLVKLLLTSSHERICSLLQRCQSTVVSDQPPVEGERSMP